MKKWIEKRGHDCTKKQLSTTQSAPILRTRITREKKDGFQLIQVTHNSEDLENNCKKLQIVRVGKDHLKLFIDKKNVFTEFFTHTKSKNLKKSGFYSDYRIQNVRN